MCSSICNKKGMSLIEVLISLFLISVGILGLISLQPKAWSLSGKSDYLGRAAGILQKELETNEALLLNPCNPNPCKPTNPFISTKNIFISGLGTAQAGDMTFTVQTTIIDNGDNSWTVVVQITWPGSTAVGISESLVVTQQEIFRSPVGCV
jgi:prepilin-type N-terminal cleavage/methylation domain-containing protein